MKNTDDRRICYGLKSLAQSAILGFIFWAILYFPGLMTLLGSFLLALSTFIFHLVVFFNVICIDNNHIKVKGVLSSLSSRSVIEVSDISKVVFSPVLSKVTYERMKVYDKENKFVTSIPMPFSFKERKLLIDHLERLGITVE